MLKLFIGITEVCATLKPCHTNLQFKTTGYITKTINKSVTHQKLLVYFQKKEYMYVDL